MADRLKIMLDRQREFQGVVDFLPVDEKDAVDISKELMLHVISECMEFMGALSWKALRKSKGQIIRDNLLVQLIDIQKLILSLACVWGFDDEDIFRMFVEKSEVVEQLYRQEFPLRQLASEDVKIVALDIDGVLSDYPRCFYEFVMVRTSVDVEDYDELDSYKAFGGAFDPIELAALKDEYRQSGAKRDIPTMQGAVAFTQALRSMGYKIVLLSSRPVKKYSRMFSDTLHWLNKNRVPYDAIMWDENKECRLIDEFGDKVVMFVDDEPVNVARVSASGIRARLFTETTFPNLLDELEADGE